MTAADAIPEPPAPRASGHGVGRLLPLVLLALPSAVLVAPPALASCGDHVQFRARANGSSTEGTRQPPASAASPGLPPMDDSGKYERRLSLPDTPRPAGPSPASCYGPTCGGSVPPQSVPAAGSSSTDDLVCPCLWAVRPEAGVATMVLIENPLRPRCLLSAIFHPPRLGPPTPVS